MTSIFPIHTSLLKRQRPIKPRGMEYMLVEPEQLETLQSIAIDIFTDMTNSGASFQESLAAVYFSGIRHALAIGGKNNGAG